jgi:hypothetical protein
MSKTLYPFGRVLFDELEQIAIRRGGFASLLSVKQELSDARKLLEESIADAADPGVPLDPPGGAAQEAAARRPSLRETAEAGTRRAREALALTAMAAESVDQLGQIVSRRVRTTQDVFENHLSRPRPAARNPIAFRSILGLIRAIQSWAQPPEDPGEDWEERKAKVKERVDDYGRKLDEAQRALRAQAIRDQVAVARRDEGWFDRVRRASRGLTEIQGLEGEDRRIAIEAHDAIVHALRAGDDEEARRVIEGRTLEEQVLRGAVIKRSLQLASALDAVAGQFDRVIKAYRDLADASEGVMAQIWGLIDVQSDESRYAIYDVIEDGARKASMRMGCVGLAFSGGGIRSATFNLGFLQGLASLGLLKQFDYLSTVSGGGYIGGWFAAWVRREGGQAGDPAPIGHADVDREAAPFIAEEERKIKGAEKKKRSPRTVIDQQVKEAARRIRSEVRETLDRDRMEQVAAKRRRTARALENVELQLNSRRHVQGHSDRRWVSSEEVRKCREAVAPPPPMLRRTVEEEPEPVYHLRAYSNYLAPKLGLLSIDTWTMVSVYLRNLLLNQFILLPMTLAAIAVPRLLLLLFASPPTGPVVALTRNWLIENAERRVLIVLGVAALAMLTALKLFDFFAQWIVRRIGDRNAGLAIIALLVSGLAATSAELAVVVFSALRAVDRPVGLGTALFEWLARTPWVSAWAILLPLALLVTFDRRRTVGIAPPTPKGLRRRERLSGWTILLLLVFGLAPSLRWLLLLGLTVVQPVTGWLSGDLLLFLATFAMAWVGFHRTYWTVALIRASREPAAITQADHDHAADLPYPLLWEQILIPLTLASFGVSLLFSRPGTLYFRVDLPIVRDWFKPGSGGTIVPALVFGATVGLMRLLAFVVIELRGSWHEDRRPIEHVGRAASALISGLVAGTVLAAVLMWLIGRLSAPADSGTAATAVLAGTSGALEAAMMSIGPLLVMIAMGAGSAIEVGLIGGYGEEDMREWRASLGAYLLLIGILWAGFSLLSIYGPLLAWAVGTTVASMAGIGWAAISGIGALAGRSAQTNGAKASRGPMEYVALIAPPVFIIGLVVAVAMLAAALQGIPIPGAGDAQAASQFLPKLSGANPLGADPRSTWAILLASAWVATIGCLYVNINLFALNAFYANRLVRCYLGASRPKEAPSEGRPTFAPTNSPVPVRRPNPITGFDPTDDFPLRDLIVVRSWRDDDLVVDYRGPYHLINTAMNLVAGSELAWQERMAESFTLSPLYCGSKTTGYRRSHVVKDDLEADEIEPDEADDPPGREVPGYGDDVRLGTAVSVSGAAASPNSGYHSSPLVAILMTVFNARLGLWFGNPARNAWRRSGPGFALYLFDELFGRTTNKGKYVYLSDGGHFENLGVYELVRRRCRYIVLCDAGADPTLSFWDLASLVRKCREDFGVRIEIDVSPLSRKEGTAQGQWHCAVGRIHYEDVDVGASPGTLFYIKPSLTGDEPSDVRNYVVDHPTFPHESTADQFFSESQFESYRVLGEHIAVDVFDAAARGAGPDPRPPSLFSRLRRQWFPPPADLDKKFLASIRPFIEVQQALRTDPNLERLSHDLYPELAQVSGAPAHPGDPRAEIHAIIEMLRVMENAWVADSLEAYSDHPRNRGWMNSFRRWTSSGIFQTLWPAVRGEFSEGFVRFCETELNLTIAPLKVVWLEDGAPAPAGRQTIALAAFRDAVTELDREFSLEWPNIVLHEISDNDSTLVEILGHVLRYPPVAGGRPKAGLIQRGVTAPGRPPTTEPRDYGVILAWASSDGPIELIIWLRGAYRTLGVGDTIKVTIDSFKKQLETLHPAGYTLRTRYPNDHRSKGKPGWQSTLWTDFFQNQGFHFDDAGTPDDDWVTLIYRYSPR